MTPDVIDAALQGFAARLEALASLRSGAPLVAEFEHGLIALNRDLIAFVHAITQPVREAIADIETTHARLTRLEHQALLAPSLAVCAQCGTWLDDRLDDWAEEDD